MPSSAAAKFIEDEKRKAPTSPAAASPTGASSETPTVRNRFNGHFFGLSAGGAEVSLVRWMEQAVGQLISVPATNETSAAAEKKASSSGEAFAGEAKEKAVAGWMRRIGEHGKEVVEWSRQHTGATRRATLAHHPLAALSRMSEAEERAEQARRGLHPLTAPFGQLMGELYASLSSDLSGDEECVAAWMVRVALAQGRFEDV